MLDRARTIQAVLVCSCWLVASVGSGEPDPPARPDTPIQLNVLWNDAYGLLPSVALEAMALEVESLFRAENVAVELHEMRRGASEPLPQPSVRVVLHPVEPKDWNLHKDVMAAAVGEPNLGYTIFVFHPAVLRTLRLGPLQTPQSVARLARAMGRVVAHEVVHVLAPGRGHAPHGLMAPRLTRRTLLQRSVWLDRTSARGVVAALAPDPSPAARPSPSLPSTFFVWTLR